MGWLTMPTTVSESYLVRSIIEGKAYQTSYEVTIPANSTIWFYSKTNPNKEFILEDRNVAATVGPIRYAVYVNIVLTGNLGDEVPTENLNKVYNRPAETIFHRVEPTSLDLTNAIKTDTKLIVATESVGNTGTGYGVFQDLFKVYPKNTEVAISLENTADLPSIVELQYLWVEDVR